MTDSNNLMIRLMAEKDELKGKVERMEKFMDKLLESQSEQIQKMWLDMQEESRKKFAEQKEQDKAQTKGEMNEGS